MSYIKILFFGDIVGKPGRKGVAKVMQKIKKDFQPDLIAGNVENMAHGKGVTEKTLTAMTNTGIEVFTSGEHIYDKATPEKAAELFNQFPTLVKPGNFMTEMPGRGDVIVNIAKGKVLVINLMGQVFTRTGVLSPWEMLPEILRRYENEKPVAVIVDFHAEATSEKVALGRHFDGKISAILGTHTHIPTKDAIILKEGTAYITDIGMNGPSESVLGMKEGRSIERFLTGEHVPYDIAESDEVNINYVQLVIDTSTAKAKSIEHVSKIVSLESRK